MSEAAIERRFRAFALACLEWGTGGIVLGAWCLTNWAIGAGGGIEVWLLPAVLCFGFALRAFVIRQDLRSGLHVHTNVAVACGSVLIAAFVVALTLEWRLGPATWLSAGLLLLTLHATASGVVLVRHLPPRGAKDLLPDDARRARTAGRMIRLSAVLALVPALWVDYDPQTTFLVLLGACGLAVLWWLGGEAARGWLDAEKARGLVLSMLVVWSWFVLVKGGLPPAYTWALLAGAGFFALLSGRLLDLVD